MSPKPLQGVGLGLRRELIADLKSTDHLNVDFFEIAPENWLGLGGRYQQQLREFTDRYPFTCHGLSLSIGGATELDTQLLKNIKSFMREHGITLYTEHLSWCSDDGHLYDLLPIPCTDDAVQWVSQRINTAQDILEMPIAIENASYYFSPPSSTMSEEAFISAIIAETGCKLHLDVNNVYVNSQNFGFNPHAYIDALPLADVSYLHVAGHYVEDDGFLIDTHGASVIDPVWQLLDDTYQRLSQIHTTLPATCLERDFNFPALSELQKEVDIIYNLRNKHARTTKAEAQHGR